MNWKESVFCKLAPYLPSPSALALLPLLPHLVASCRLWKVRLGKLADKKLSSSPRAEVFLFLVEAWTAARKAFQVCFSGPVHRKIKSGSHCLLGHWAVPTSARTIPSPPQPLLPIPIPATPTLHLSAGLPQLPGTSGFPDALTAIQLLL